MKFPRFITRRAAIAGCFLCASVAQASGYQNFAVAVYARAYEVRQMKDPAWLESRWAAITNGLKVDKIYLETHRDGVIPDQQTLDLAKRFFASKGVRTAGGIATVVNERNRFETFVYTNPEQRKKLQEIVEYTARNFDEIIIDDFFFTSSKSDADIQAKGDKSWTRFRLDLMAEVSRNLLVGPAKKVNPRVKMVIKYPNWYEHYQYSGYNLEDEPKIFDGIYTGTETRDPARGNQHLQQYLGYDLVRYLENIKPGGNGGGWVDPGGWRDKERYGEQLWLTLFAKAPEIMLFDFRQLLTLMRGGPQGGEVALPGYAGSVFAQVDGFIGKLGKPIGVASYKPYHSSGEDYLHDYLGMIGIPIDMVPAFPTDRATVLLTESARFDPALVGKIKKQLVDGKKVVITSGLLKALQGKGIEDIAELEVTSQKAMVHDFPRWGGSSRSETDILIPEIRYATNDAWDILTTAAKGTGYPMLLQAGYSKGTLYVLTIPDNFGDLYNLPPEVLTQLRAVIAGDLPVRLEGPSQVGLFAYDNGKFIVENFAAPGGNTVSARAVVDGKFTKLVDVESGQALSGQTRGDKMVFDLTLPPASYRVLSAEQATASR
jgi:hypothetical protein